MRSGNGGAGCVSFRREKFVEFGGPDGGDGGDGGSIYVRATAELNTLFDFRYRRHLHAPNGMPGRGKRCDGAKGSSITIDVPVGTEILDDHESKVLHDLIKDGQTVLLAAGGKGGFGNRRFLTSTNQAPLRANSGQSGIEMTIWLRLKLFADVGLLGLPNAGKSTLLSAITCARPKVADYPFTTLHPVLGLLSFGNRTLVVADIPGLIEGAHKGRGIGDRFLGHIERCQVLIHLLDITSDQLNTDYETIMHEIEQYGCGLPDKPRLTFLSKADAVSREDQRRKQEKLAGHIGNPVGLISAYSREGVQECLRQMTESVRTVSKETGEAVPWTP